MHFCAMLRWRRGEAEPKIFFASSLETDLTGYPGSENLGAWLGLISRSYERRVPERDPSRIEDVTKGSVRDVPETGCGVDL